MANYNYRPTEDRFLEKVERIPFSGCWVWMGALNSGYGWFRLRERPRPSHAHRISYELFRGPVPRGMHVCHQCDVRACVNPDHLFLGTNRDNILDSIKKGRRIFGEKKERHKLSDEQNNQAKILRAGGLSWRAVGKKLGVSCHTAKAAAQRAS